MFSSLSSRVLLTTTLAASLLAVGCDSIEYSTTDEEIVGGFEATPGVWSSTVVINYAGEQLCGGTYIAPGWVLSAAHCFAGRDKTQVEIVAGRHNRQSAGGYVASVKRIIPHAQYNPVTMDNDIAVVELNSYLPIPFTSLAGKYEMAGVAIGEPATVIGWGATTYGGASSSTLQQAELDVIGVGGDCEVQTLDMSVTDNQVCIGRLSGGVAPCNGDSGGPAFIRRGTEWVQLGIASWIIKPCGGEDHPAVYTLVPNYREWIAQQTQRGRLRYTTADFDESLSTDLIITNHTGSYWYFAAGNGTWTYPYTQPLLPFLEVEYTPGDFNNDFKTDLIVTTHAGSYWYLSNGDGTWTISYTRPDLPLGSVRYVTGDFNGDWFTDLVIQNKSGAYWYFSDGGGTWTQPYIRPDLKFGHAEFVVGNFNGDWYSDLIITTAGGSYWYFSNGDGTWTIPYSRPDLPRGKVAYTPADFDGNGKTDLVITTAGGSYWYLSNGNGTWTYPYTRHDLPLGKVRYVPANFNPDGKTDLVITTAGGSYWYFSNGNGLFTERYTRTDLPLGIASYTVGDFDPDAKDDLVITTPTGSHWYLSNGDGTWRNPYNRYDLPL